MYVKTDNDAVNQTKLADVFYVDEAYSKNHAHMLHKHKGILELLYVSEGEGRYIVGSREYAVAAGDLIICNAETIHGEAPFQAHTMQTYCCALSGVHKQALPPGCLISSYQRPVLQLDQYQKPIGQIMPNIYELHIASPRNSDICRQMAISVLLMVEQALDLHGKQERNQIEQKNETLIRQITEYLDHHYTESLSLAEIAKHMHISTSYLSHIFKRETGLSPIQYVIHRRIGEAQSLLMETNLPVHVIEERLGFGSSCHLTSMFKKYVGIAPREYRRHFSKSHNKKADS
ncbi:MAG: AraC family transcriptional regulator [Butyricicoccus pullicaecorum]|nr:AraC family transcriptional regulator [Butyricicoccus pullicaecorum]